MLAVSSSKAQERRYPHVQAIRAGLEALLGSKMSSSAVTSPTQDPQGAGCGRESHRRRAQSGQTDSPAALSAAGPSSPAAEA
jgi:hypothetical protein